MAQRAFPKPIWRPPIKPAVVIERLSKSQQFVPWYAQMDFVTLHMDFISPRLAQSFVWMSVPQVPAIGPASDVCQRDGALRDRV
jgi:hypothetical protein